MKCKEKKSIECLNQKLKKKTKDDKNKNKRKINKINN